jgi:hypothetical protein
MWTGPPESKFISLKHHWTSEGTLQKSGQKPKDQLRAPSIKWPWTWKCSGMVDRTSRREIHFTQTPLDYKSSDLEYRLLQEHYKKAVRSQKDQLKAPSIKWLLGWKHSEIVRRTSECQKCITQTPLDHRCIGLGCKLLKRLQSFDVPKMQSLFKSATNQKRDIVDTPTHAFCSFGHGPSLGLAFPTTWELA